MRTKKKDNVQKDFPTLNKFTWLPKQSSSGQWGRI